MNMRLPILFPYKLAYTAATEVQLFQLKCDRMIKQTGKRLHVCCRGHAQEKQRVADVANICPVGKDLV